MLVTKIISIANAKPGRENIAPEVFNNIIDVEGGEYKRQKTEADIAVSAIHTYGPPCMFSVLRSLALKNSSISIFLIFFLSLFILVVTSIYFLAFMPPIGFPGPFGGFRGGPPRGGPMGGPPMGMRGHMGQVPLLGGTE